MAVEILCIEDNVADRRLIREFFKTDGTMHFAFDGVEGLDYLHRRGPFAGAALPDLILLDLNLPKKSGHEVLREIKSDPELRHIPVVVLTTSSNASDISKSYEARANCYLVKPDELEQFEAVMDKISDFWLKTAHICPRPPQL